MKPFTKILVPIDFSAHSDEAIRYAADLSYRYGASTTLAHAYLVASFVSADAFAYYSPSIATSMLAALDGLLDQAKTDSEAAGALRVRTKLIEGDARSEIVNLAKTEGHDLIVMGTHGRTGLSRALLGSVAESVVRRAACPVLTVGLAEHR